MTVFVVAASAEGTDRGKEDKTKEWQLPEWTFVSCRYHQKYEQWTFSRL